MKHLINTSLAIIFSFSTLSVQANETEIKPMTAEQLAEKERCTVPGYAKAIGHEELWKKHNGCLKKEEANNNE